MSFIPWLIVAGFVGMVLVFIGIVNCPFESVMGIPDW